MVLRRGGIKITTKRICRKISVEPRTVARMNDAWHAQPDSGRPSPTERELAEQGLTRRWPAKRRLSRRGLLGGVGALTAAAGLAACGDSSGPSGAGTSPNPSAKPNPNPNPSPAPIDEAVLRKKIASLLVVGFRGATLQPDDWIMRAIREQGLGGVILFDRDQQTGARRNIISPRQVSALVRTLKQQAPQLIVSIDQEGGRISRLNPSNGFPATRSQAQIGAINRNSVTHAWAQGMVTSMRSIGVNLNFAPVLDLDVNPSNPAVGALGRSFSANPVVVVGCAGEEIRTHRAGGVRTVVKHFPGLGSATGNTDFGVVDVTKTWRRAELEPYQALLKAKLVDCVMAAHVLNHQLDPSRPASLSKAVVTGLLRDQLGWRGPVASDDMQAVAITSRYGAVEAVTLAMEAGVDMLVFGNQAVYNPKVVQQTVDTIVGLVRQGKVSVAAIDSSAARIDSLRPSK
jgi:beta-N-acetylhexosaminidase